LFDIVVLFGEKVVGRGFAHLSEEDRFWSGKCAVPIRGPAFSVILSIAKDL
jgi:hypothetical protein